ncbi:hypothetical protein A6302_04498 [Methylobrevis pamukkalensis]|uniref:Uncharacterized protein n=1 Tax=Methylobrevis pamukkalensis TaxID=1439726 RepID=A0A1E3GNY4_9HYPH|nr:hypothetical protein A6302_04498 [Methylobrevis pamukkalensis]
MTALPPPKAEKSTVTPAIVSALRSPRRLLSQTTVTVSPILKAPPVPVAPLAETLPSVATGAAVSTTAWVSSPVVTS